MSNYKYKYLKYKKKYLFLKNQTGGMYNYLFGASDNPTPAPIEDPVEVEVDTATATTDVVDLSVLNHIAQDMSEITVDEAADILYGEDSVKKAEFKTESGTRRGGKAGFFNGPTKCLAVVKDLKNMTHEKFKKVENHILHLCSLLNVLASKTGEEKEILIKAIKGIISSLDELGLDIIDDLFDPFEAIEFDFDPPSKEIVLPNSDTVILTQYCCDGYTQYPKRMLGCEDASHDAIAMAPNLPAGQNLDGIIGLLNKYVSPPSNFKVETMITLGPERDEASKDISDHAEGSAEGSAEGLLGPKKDEASKYISDHDGVGIVISHNDRSFNLLSYNLEGLCNNDYGKGIFGIRLQNLIEQLSNPAYLIPGFLMVAQEVVLQMAEADQIETLKSNGEQIVKALNEKSREIKIAFISDKFTGGIFYDTKYFKLDQVIQIPRPGSKKNSNAYLLRVISSGLPFIIVNIHLKARKRAILAGSSVDTLLQDYLNFTSMDEIHREELVNILKNVSELSERFRIPVFMLGDYNNPTPKTSLIESALKSL